MHLTPRLETPKSAGGNFLQQGKFDDVIDGCRRECPSS
jgi:hypothetical protein